MTHEELLKTLQWQLGQRILGFDLAEDDLWVRVGAEDWLAAGQTCRDQLGCSYFTFLSGMDWLVNPALDGEKAFEPGPEPASEESPEPVIIVDQVQRRAGGTTRFQVMARVQNVEDGCGLTLTADLPEDDLRVASWVSVYAGADWHERETWEMFGFGFDGHPGLRHIYLPDQFEGFPLRKDFPLVARLVRPWPGLVDLEDMPAVAQGEAE